MKKWAILLFCVGLVVVGWYVARQQTFTPPWALPKYGEISRGDIRVPITASGLIHANQVIEVKPEASGEVTDVPVVEGRYVQKGDTLVVMDPDDEQRMLDRAMADYDRAVAMLTQATVAVDRAQNNIESAKTRLKELEASEDIAKYDLDKLELWEKEGRRDMYNPQQLHDARARYRMTLAQIESARIAVRAAELAKQDSEAAVKSQEATVTSARKNLEDAEERLRETTVLAPQEAIVTQVFVKPGMLVQSGTQSLTGGTPLMTLADVSKKKVIARLQEADYGRVLDISPLDALPEMPKLREAAEQDAERIESRSGIVRITVDAFPDDYFEGQIGRVEPQGKLASGSSVIQFDVHVEIIDPMRHKLPLGAQAQVEFTVESAIDVLRVPAEAVKTLEDQRGVYVKVDPPAGEAFGKEFVPCRFGITDGEYTEVLEVLGTEELKAGMTVYTKLPQDIRDEE
jgi:multidrug efflux pump subunit AcrA (membrane-fusion protein)